MLILKQIKSHNNNAVSCKINLTLIRLCCICYIRSDLKFNKHISVKKNRVNRLYPLRRKHLDLIPGSMLKTLFIIYQSIFPS